VLVDGSRVAVDGSRAAVEGSRAVAGAVGGSKGTVEEL